jgi:3-oxoacyl-[acyl-carrier-protein] synthase II
MSAPRPDGSQTAQAMRNALDDARLSPGEVETINAHGSSTPLGDRAELLAYRLVFGDRATTIPIAATKGQHGHALGATGSWEIAVSAMTLCERRLPGGVNFTESDEGFSLEHARAPRALDAAVLLSNSSGFGGINAALVLQRVE